MHWQTWIERCEAAGLVMNPNPVPHGNYVNYRWHTPGGPWVLQRYQGIEQGVPVAGNGHSHVNWGNRGPVPGVGAPPPLYAQGNVRLSHTDAWTQAQFNAMVQLLLA